MTDNHLGRVLAFMRQLWELDHRLQSASKGMAAAIGVTGPQRLVVRMVGRFPGVSAGGLSDLLHLHPSTLTGVLERLVAAGLLKRAQDPDDQRRARFRLTEKGRAIDRRKQGTVEAATRRALRPVPLRDIEVAAAVLRRITEALGALSTSEGSARKTRRR